ncbi:hypothetical protein [Micromonospora sp. NPDC005324]|uniref:hypothetical protein n=1 Tax=Micromonospora sp. NPDC005324 TaxID=3157033 RepID=UPI0033AF0402
MSTTSTQWPQSPLDAAEVAFTALTCDPAPLSIDLDQLGPDVGLPAGVMTVLAVRDWLLAHRTSFEARDAVWAEMIRRARLDGPQWVIGAVGMALPALRRYTRQLCNGYPGDPDDIEAEVLSGFLVALRDHVDLARPAPYAGLCRAGWRAGYKLRQQAAEFTPVEDIEHVIGPRTPQIPYGHPDVLINRAVRLGILDADDEQSYIDVRLGRRAIEPIAALRGLSTDALRMRLGRIDTRIAEALASGLLTGTASPQAAKALAAQAERRSKLRAASRRPARQDTSQAAAAA